MKLLKVLCCCLCFLLIFTWAHGQQQHLIIGRTTGELLLDGEKVRVFGFTNTLSGQVTLPGTSIELITGDSALIDFWNISQGNPHVIFMDSIALVRTTSDGGLAEEQAVYHMDHGYYQFTAPAPGTYLYYCSENFPLNLRAGMFGVMIVRPKTPLPLVQQELLWCSFEMDPAWQQLAIRAAEEALEPDELPDYQPKYFLLNGRPFKETEISWVTTEKSSAPILIRLVNAGHWQQEISFPKDLRLQLLDERKTLLKTKHRQHFVLAPRETCELLLELSQINKKRRIKYIFRDPETGRMKHRAFLPVY